MNREPRMPLTLPAALRFTRTLWSLMLISIVVFIATAERTAPASRHQSRSLFFAITLLAIWAAAGWRIPQVKFVREAARRLVQDRKDARALKRWQSGYVLSFMLSEAVALYGLILRYEGFPLKDVAAFYALGLILMILSAPKAPHREG